jgi:hypothetical protein
MVKTNILTPVLAAVLGVTVIGSGVGYYVLNKDGVNQSNKSKNGLGNVADNIGSTLDTAEKAIKGELDFSYNATATVSFGEGFTDVAGQSYQSLKLDTVTKQKGKSTSADFTLSYGDSSVMSVNTVIDRENQNVYAQIPELSDGYLLANEDSAKAELKEQGVDLDTLISDSTETTDFDSEAFEKSLDEYEAVIKENLPEGTETDGVSGTVSGVSYDYTAKSYTITGNDFTKVGKAILEKAKTDEILKDAYEEYKDSSAASYTLGTDTDSIPTYEEAIDEIISEFDSEISGDEDSVTFVAYYNKDGEFSGFDITPDDEDEEGEIKAIYVVSDEACAVDLNYNVDDQSLTLTGAITTVDGVSNGSYDFALVSGSETVKMMYEVTDLKAVGDTFSGSMRTDVNFTDGDTAVSGWYEMSSASTEDNMDLKFEVGLNGKSFVTVGITGNKTEASDITVPSGDNIYDITDEDQLNSYLEGCDIDGFNAKLQEALGDDLYNLFFGGDYEDYDYDSDDYSYWDDDYNDVLIDYSDDYTDA